MASASEIRAGRAFVELTLKDAALRKGLAGVKATLSNFVSGFGIAAGIASWGQMREAISGAITSFAEGGDRIGKMSKRTGVGTRALSELGFAAEQSGQGLDVLETTLKKMEKTIGSAFMGGGEAAKSLHMLGVGLDQLQGKSPDEQFEIISEAMSKIQDPAKRATLAMQIFGRSGTDLLPLMMKGAKGIRALREEAKDLGLSKSPEDVAMAEELSEAYQRLGKVRGSIFSKIGAALAPAMLESVKYVTRIGVATGKWISENRELIATVGRIGSIAVAAATGVGALGLGLSLAAKAAGGLGVIGSILGAIVSPVGLITAALAGGVYAWVKYTESGQAAYASVSEVLSSMLATAKETFGGISDALQGGDLALAGRIGMLGLKVAMMQIAVAISESIGGVFGDLIGKLGSQLSAGDLSGAWGTAVSGLAAIWSQFSLGVTSVFQTAMTEILKSWRGTTGEIANWILKNSSRGGLLGRFLVGVDSDSLNASAGAGIGAAGGAWFGGVGAIPGAMIGGSAGFLGGMLLGPELGKGVDTEGEAARDNAYQQKRRQALEQRLYMANQQLKEAEANGGVTTDAAGVQTTSEELRRIIADLEAAMGQVAADFVARGEQAITDSLGASADKLNAAIEDAKRQAQENADKSKAALAPEVAGGANAASDELQRMQNELGQARAAARRLREAQEKREKERDDAAKEAAEGASGASSSKEVMGSFSAAALAAGGATRSPLERVANAAEKQADLMDATVGLLGKSHTIQSMTLDAVRDGGLVQ